MNTTRPTTTRAVHLASRPHGAPTEDNFRIEEVGLPNLSDGQILVANDVMSVDPYMRGRMDDVESYVPPFQIGKPLDGGAVGTVIESRSEKIPEGSHVVHQLGWREHAVLGADDAHIIDTGIAPASAYLSVLGMTGLTAYAGLTRAAEMKAGDVVFVSGAAGAVGSMVGQVARLLGASRVIGSAGTDAKVARLRDLGFDAAFNYHDGSVTDLLGRAAPDGIDVYFDNVGGDHLEAAIDHLNNDGRVAMCGAISQYNSVEPPSAPRNLALAIGKRLTLRGFVLAKYAEETRPEFQQRMAGWLSADEIHWDETFRDGLDAAPKAFIDMLEGANTGKMLVRL
ncbi:NADP-dependent oxidoreductase [Cutibacterium sp. WCA-380-WT-3A]|uniref:NADP-dependent oxidoreductase n=1 Tax=Cutibacterium porci TaxID=2605781 RepID=A0A7K0J598_9ACTN|nr:NADP-dependent oxidoreductase [Cutibacterium porci]MSS45087.1 NADP-dependent oxidoreductase [Cutibacterium porci]